jgi:signal transduction histidine kinase/ligand-binding sensor domain-containing protein/DNA-binding response OmpR family regulator
LKKLTKIFIFSRLNLAIAGLLLWAASAGAVPDNMGTLIIQRYNINSGLSSDNLKALVQDREGYLWIASDNGLNRFDGYKTTIFKPDFSREKTFNSVVFTCIAEDKAGNLWLGTDHSGINVFNKRSQEVTIIDRYDTTGLAILDNSINHILCDSKGRIWISMQGGLNLYYPDSRKMVTFSGQSRPGKNNPFGTISYAYEDRSGKILIGTWGNGVYVYDEFKDDFTQILVGTESNPNDTINRVVRILEDRKGNFWFGTWEGGLFKVRLNDYQSLEVLQFYSMNSGNRFSVSSNIFYSLFEDADGSIWAGTPFGLNLIRNPESNNPDVILVETGEGPGNISQNDVFAILCDRSGIIWLATGGGGLNKVDPQLRRIDAYTIPVFSTFRETQSIRSFIVDVDSSLLVGVNGFGFGRYLLKERKFIPYTSLPRFKGLPRDLNAATCFLLDNEKNLWIGTRYKGLFMVSGTTGSVNHLLDYDSVTGDRSRMINSIYEDRFGNKWVGTSTGLFKFVKTPDADGYRTYRYLPDEHDPGSIAGDYISAIYEDSESNIWIGTVGGALNRVKNSAGHHAPLQFRHFSVDRDDPRAIRSNIVYAIIEDRQKRLWIGTGTAGLALFHPEDESFSSIITGSSMRGDAVFDIIEESDNLWLTTSNGLIRFSQKGTGEYQTEIFNSEDGLHGNVFIDGAAYKSSDGRIFVGGYYGFNVFRPGDLFSNTFIPPVVVTDIRVSNERVNVYEALAKGLTLRHDQNSISLEFSALSFSQPLKNNYAYMLEGLDEDWTRTNSDGRLLNYSHIPPGYYTLRLKASNSSDVWNEEPVTLSLRVKPHPARSWWAIVIYSAFLLFVLIAIYYFLINNIKIKQAYEIEKIERKKEENVNQFKFRFFTNISHELLTPLSVLSFSIEDLMAKRGNDDGQLGIMQRNVNRVMHLISQLLDFRKVESGSMMPSVSPGRIDTFIEQICTNLKPLEGKKNITVTVNGQVDRPIFFDHDKLDKIVCNLLANAFRYTPENGRILVNYHIYQKNGINWLRLEVIDSGKGIEPENLEHVFERFYQVKSVTGRTFGAGIGLALARNLAENHKGSISVQNEENMGAKFTVDIPVSAEAYDKYEIKFDEIAYQSGNIIVDHDDRLVPIEEELTEEVEKDRKKTILIVEDNDDFRILLRKHLSNFYHTLEAENGQVAYDICLNRHPDLVITDMMMPVMNGIELCKKIKNSIETSHIVVILLTARVDEETRYESYLASADSYISKPVDMRTLDIRIESLLAQRAKLIRRYSHQSVPSTVPGGFSALDEKFLNNIKSIIEAKIMNTELNVLALSKEIGMSTSNLYRKITSLTGMSPVEFIRYIRLQAAAAMMIREGANVSEAASRSGFNDLSYFCKSFKKQFGVSPKKYQKSEVPLTVSDRVQ